MEYKKTCWDILEIEPTEDIKIIKKAFSIKARNVHPEEDEENFMKLRQAYEQALFLARMTKTISLEVNNHEKIVDISDNSQNTREVYKSKLLEFNLVSEENLEELEEKLNKVMVDSYFKLITDNRTISVNQIIYEQDFDRLINNRLSVIYLLGKTFDFLKYLKASDDREAGTLLELVRKKWSNDKEVIEKLEQIYTYFRAKENYNVMMKKEKTKSKILGLSILSVFALIIILSLTLQNESKPSIDNEARMSSKNSAIHDFFWDNIYRIVDDTALPYQDYYLSFNTHFDAEIMTAYRKSDGSYDDKVVIPNKDIELIGQYQSLFLFSIAFEDSDEEGNQKRFILGLDYTGYYSTPPKTEITYLFVSEDKYQKILNNEVDISELKKEFNHQKFSSGKRDKSEELQKELDELYIH